MKIAVCCKLTPDTEDISPAADGSVSAAKANWSVSEYDLQAIQAATDMRKAGDEVVALTVGGPITDQSNLIKALMSRGSLDRLVRVVDDAAAEADASVIAKALAELVRKVDADLVLFGEGSSDRYARVTGSLVAAELGWPCVNAVDAIAANPDSVVVERDVEDGVEVVELSVPCALAVTSTINIPTTPGMKAVLAAGKKPVETFTLADLGVASAPAITCVSSEVPPKPGRRLIMLEGAPDEAASELVAKLKADHVL